MQHYKQTQQQCNLDGLLQTEGTVFDELIKEHKSLRKLIFDNLLEILVSTFKQDTAHYFKRRLWAKDTSESKYAFDISAEIAEALSLLKERLHTLQHVLNALLFKKFWQQLAEQLNSYIFQQLLNKFQYSKRGALQFNNDMQALFLLWKPFTAHPHNFFKE